APEEVGLERQAEQAREAQVAGVVLELGEDRVADAVAEPLVVDRDRADLAEVLPDDVQGAAADERAVRGLRDHELLDVLAEGDALLAQQGPPLHVRVAEAQRPGDIGGARAAHPELLGHLVTLTPPGGTDAEACRAFASRRVPGCGARARAESAQTGRRATRS